MKNEATFTTEEKTLIDSNVLVYAYDLSSTKHAKAEKIIGEFLLNRNGVVSCQNLAELSRVLCEKIPNKIPFYQVRNIVLELSENLEVLTYDSHTVADALSACDAYGIHFFDALIAATMENWNVKTIITENDADFKKIKWIKTINPFVEK